MRSSAKRARCNLGDFLLGAGYSRNKIKRLIRYPTIKKLRIATETSEVDISIEASDENTNVSLTGKEKQTLSGEVLQIDESSKSAKVALKMAHKATNWSAIPTRIEIEYSNGEKRNQAIAGNMSGDGTGPATIAQLEIEIPTAEGWSKLG
jgi:hypothetical protein